MHIQIRNFLGIASADIPLASTPVVVTGPNASGKTSLSRAIGGLLSRNANPLGLATSKRRYVRDDADDGEVSLIDDAGNQVRWWRLLEAGIREQPEAPKGISQHAIGLTDFIELSPQYRVKAWESCFLPAPKVLVELVGAQLRNEISRSAVVDEVISMLRTKSWQDAEAVFRYKATEAKREWSQTAGEPYGSKKADNWSPAGWRSELDAMTPAEGATRLEECREGLRGVQIGQAVRESDLDRAKQYAAEVPNIEKEIAVLVGACQTARKTMDAAQAAYSATRDKGLALRDELQRHDRDQPVREDTTPCPACGEALVVGPNRTLSRARDDAAFEAMQRAWSMGREKINATLIQLRAAVQKIHDGRVKPAKAFFVETAATLAESRSRLSVAQREAALADRGGRVVTDEDQRLVAEGEQAVEDARVCLDLITQRHAAHNAHMNAVNYGTIAHTLGPKGIRARAMKEKMEALRDQLREMEAFTRWPKVELDAAYAVSIHGRPGVVCAASEQWRANVMLQAAIAIVRRETYIVADGADILRDAALAQFVELVDWWAERGVYAIVTATGHMDVVPSTWNQVEIVDGQGVSE